MKQFTHNVFSLSSFMEFLLNDKFTNDSSKHSFRKRCDRLCDENVVGLKYHSLSPWESWA
jgi:hypothetical protein